jgi:hypothetical protein
VAESKEAARQIPGAREDQCRATTTNLFPAERCDEATGHGRVHHSEHVWWIGEEPPADEGASS